MTRSRQFRCSIAAVTLLLAATPADAQLKPIQLFLGSRASEVTAVLVNREPHVRARVASFNMTSLENIVRESAVGLSKPSLQLELFDDVTVTVPVEKVASFGLGRFVIRGVVAHDAGETSALFSVVDGALQGEVTIPDGRKFVIDDLGGNACRVSEIDLAAATPRCLTEENELLPTSVQRETTTAAPAPGATKLAGRAIAVDGDPVVDIMIVYTPAMLRLFSSVSAMEAHCQLAVEFANMVFEKSLVRARVRLVHTALVDYTESGSDLARLVNPADGYLDEVAALREQYQADVVHLFGSDGSTIGQATLYPGDNFGILMGRNISTFVHELGHNFGCQHDREAPNGAGISYAYGHIFKAGSRFYGCIMSYTGSAGAHQINYFSNPDVTYLGTSIGVPKGRPDAADNARMIDATAPVLAAYRAGNGSSSRVPVIASPPRLDFPVTPGGSISPSQNLRLSFNALYSWRPIRITDFRVNGDAPAFQVEMFDNNTRQFISGDSFAIAPYSDVQLYVRFQPSSPQLAEANISFKVADPTFLYDVPPIRLTGNRTAPLLRNISTRGNVGTGENVLIGGLILGGTSTRNVMIRAVGASLAGSGVPGALRDPVIEVYQGSTLIAQNDDWGDGFGYESIRWSGLAPADDLESAVVMKLQPGSYTAIMRGFGDTTGVGVIETYDLDASPETQLLNISTRGTVQAGDNVMIGGFIVGGTSPARVAVRALGPSLATAGVSGVLPDPAVTLHDNQGTRIALNDNWRSDNESEIIAAGMAPQDDREAVLVAILSPAAYTAIVRGANQTSGVAVVEVYKLDAQ